MPRWPIRALQKGPMDSISHFSFETTGANHLHKGLGQVIDSRTDGTTLCAFSWGALFQKVRLHVDYNQSALPGLKGFIGVKRAATLDDFVDHAFWQTIWAHLLMLF